MSHEIEAPRHIDCCPLVLSESVAHRVITDYEKALARDVGRLGAAMLMAAQVPVEVDRRLPDGVIEIRTDRTCHRFKLVEVD